MTPEQMKDKAMQWNDLQVLAHDAEIANNTTDAAKHRTNAEAIERELEAAGTNIRALVCP